MAKLVLDIQVKNAKTAEKTVKEIGKLAEKAAEAAKSLSGSASFTKLVSEADKVKTSLKHVVTETTGLIKSLKEADKDGFKDLVVRTKAFLKLEKQVNDEIEEQAKLTALLERNKGGNSNLARLGKEVTEEKKKTKALKDQADALGLTAEATRKLAAEEKKRKADQSGYWLRQIKEQETAKKKLAAAEKKHLADVAKKEKAFQKMRIAGRKRTASIAAKNERDRLKAIDDAQRKSAAYHMKKMKWLKQEAAQSKGGLGGMVSKMGKSVVGGAAAGIAAGAVLTLQNAVSSLFRSITSGAAAVVSSWFNINTEMEQTKILLSTALGGGDAGEKMFGTILEMAEKIPFSIASISDSFVKIETAGIKDATGWVTALSDSISAFGGDNDDLHLATIAIQQMAGKGVVSMEELRRQLGERVPTAIRHFAREMNTTYGELVATIATGGLEFNESTQAALLRGLETHAGAAEARMESMKGAVVRASNAWTKFMMSIGESNNLFKKLADVIVKVSENLTTFANSDKGKNLIEELTTKAVEFIELFKNPAFIENSLRAIMTIGSVLLTLFTKLILMAADLADRFNRPGGEGSDYAMQAFSVVDEEPKPKQETFRSQLEKQLEGLNKTVEDTLKGAHKVAIEVDTGAAERKLLGLEQKINAFSDIKQSLGERKFEIEIGFMSDKKANAAILAKVRELKQAAIEAGDGSISGYKTQITLLERSKSLLDSMKTEGKKVSKEQVKAAKKRWDYQNRITRGGKSAYGTAKKSYKEAYENYQKLQKAYKSGEKIVDDKAIKAQKKATEELLKIELAGIKAVEGKAEAIAKEHQAILDTANTQEELDRITKEFGINAVDAFADATTTAEKYAVVIDELIRKTKELNSGEGNPETADQSSNADPSKQYARGGQVSGEQVQVGEFGKELFTPGVKGFITPAHMLGMGGGDTVNLNLSIGGSDPIALQGSRPNIDKLTRLMEDRARFSA